ncbi:MAG: tetratricopeptide repeat protein [Alphaproteobacteria bacterium]|nr:tetratricopeptide repeat protein [Alphaproteobacteria bacterium]
MTQPSFAPIVQLYQSGQHALAAAQCRSLLSVNPKHPDANHLLGVILLQGGHVPDAVSHLEAAVQARRSNHDAQMLLGQALGMSGQLEAALRCFEKVVRAQPDNLPALYNLGLSQAYLGRHEASRQIFAKLLAKDSKNVDYWVGQGNALAALGESDRATDSFAKANSLARGHPDLLERLAMTYLSSRRFEEAAAIARQALSIRPLPRLRAILGHALYVLEAFDSAEIELRSAVHDQPNDTQTRTLLASLLRRVGKLDEAHDMLADLVKLVPTTRLNFSLCLKDMGRLEEALAQADAALALNQGNPDMRHCRAQLLLQAGQLEEGWREYAARFDTVIDPVARLNFSFPPLSPGDDPAKETVLVWPEQSIGAQITFVSALPDLIDRAGAVELMTFPKLVPLFSRSFPKARVFASQHETKASRHMPSGDLFSMFRRKIESFPKAPYLVSDPDKVASISSRLDSFGPGLKVGIGWRSTSVNRERQKHFFSSLLQLGPILSVLGVVFVNFQPKSEPQELDEARRAFGCRIENFEDIDLFDDLDTTAALSSALDLVVSNGSANAFLAAALGTPVWMFFLADAHWDKLGSDHIPWLPSLVPVERLWNESWDSAVKRIADALDSSVRNHSLIAPQAASPLRMPL